MRFFYLTINFDNFCALLGASDFDYLEMDGRLCGLVASLDDDGVQVMGLTYLANVFRCP